MLASQAPATPPEPLAPRHRWLRQMLPSTLTLLESLTTQVPWSLCATRPLLAGWVSSALPPRPEAAAGPRVLLEINFKRANPLPIPSDPHSLCEIYLRVVPSEGWVSRRPGGP